MSDLQSAVQIVEPGNFEPREHFYPQVINAQLHSLVRYFFSLGNERIATRYCHMHPEADPQAVERLLTYVPTHMRWAGADLFHTTNERGVRHMVVIETNSSPSGQKSMPSLDEHDDQVAYRRLLERAFLPMLRRRSTPPGALAVLYDKNPMETRGYARTLSDLTGERVYLVELPKKPDPERDQQLVRCSQEGVLEIGVEGEWVALRGALKYVTQKPWSRIPPVTRTAVFNPVLVCLAGGRNKLVAAKAYDLINGEWGEAGMRLHIPETIWDVSMGEVQMWLRRMGGVGVVKVPYSNAGQGVYTITNEAEYEAFMQAPHDYDRFIVQALIGNANWSSRGAHGRLYHVGTVPDRHRNIYVADLRFMVGGSEDGYFPVAMYARRARSPLTTTLRGDVSSWDMLGTNLSINLEGGWDTDPKRLMLMDNRDFNRLGLGLDDLIEGYIQTLLAVTAVDQMACQLVNSRGRFRRRRFASLNPDPSLLNEIIP